MTEGPFLWISERGSPWGFHKAPPGGLCLSAFLFVQRQGKLLVGRYADDARWEQLAGLDADRRRVHGQGWTLPASHLKFGEDPRDAAQRIAREHLGLPGLALGEPRVASETALAKRFPEVGPHMDVWFLFDAHLDRDVACPPWYAALAWKEPRGLAWARSHEDVWARWSQA
jgi:hypothetical protein